MKEGITTSPWAPPGRTPRVDGGWTWRRRTWPLSGAGQAIRLYRNSGVVASRNLESVVVIKKGLSVSGRIVDGSGQPIKWARAIIGSDVWGTNPPTATSDERGEFALENCVAGPTIITVQAEGFAPRIQDVRIEEKTAPVEFRLSEPGSSLRVRVVDVRDKPVAGASIFADTWRGHRSINYRTDTDADGRFQWRSAPKDVVLYDLLKQDYMSGRRVPLTASGREQTVVLYPELIVTGRVTDAETGRPVPKFRVVKGWQSAQQPGWRDPIDWSENMAVEVAGGPYTASFRDSRERCSSRSSAGLQPAQSRAFKPTEGSQTFDFKLERAAALAGIVSLPDGKPAAGAEVSRRQTGKIR